MKTLLIVSGSVLLLSAALFFVLTLICFVIPFYSKREKAPPKEEFRIPTGEIYEPFREQMVAWMKETRATPSKEYFITSFDGLTLHGVYYESIPGAPVELMFHGYRGSAERDLCGGMQRCFSLGRNAFIVDQRASGKSGGHVISFGINESRDCLSWVDHLIKTLGPDVRIILCGISMGASTVMLASGSKLPENVVGVLADCGFSSAKEIIVSVIKKMGLPPRLLYPFVRLGARLWGGFDPESDSPLEAVRRSSVPTVFFHGEDDDFVPCEMSRACFEACASEKKLVTVPGAGHGLSYLVDPGLYLSSLREFFPEHTKL